MSHETGYLHLNVGKGRCTVAFRKAPPQPYTDQTYTQVALSFCSPKDQFSRQRGRQIAEGRLNAEKFMWQLPCSEKLGEVRKKIRQVVADSVACKDDRFPHWALK